MTGRDVIDTKPTEVADKNATEMMYHWPGLGPGPGQYCIPRILPSYQSCPPRWTHYALVDCGEKEREVVIVFGSLPGRLNVED